MGGAWSDQTAVVAILSALAASAGLALFGTRLTRVALLVQSAAGAVLVIEGLSLATGREVAVHVGSMLGVLSVDLRYDALSGLFLIALGLLTTSTSLFALGHHGAIRSRGDSFAYAAFLMSMAALFGAGTAFTFLLAWEAMALSSAALVFGPAPKPSTVRAGYIYLALTHLASAALVAAFAILGGPDGRLDFGSMRVAAQTLDPAGRDVVFVLLLLGFATKAGLVPLHVWLPRAHPEAPSHASALMSGVMVTAGVFGVLRMIIGILGPGPIWWALVLLALGSFSAVLGGLYAVVERDLKRLLAYSTIENAGVIFMGLGVALLGGSIGQPALAALGIGAALVHTLNHATFKGVLFLAAGSIDGATGTRDLDRLGGLARTMPWTSLLFGIGALSLAGVPPFSGFAGEWLTFQSLLTAATTVGLDSAWRFASVLTIGALSLSAGLALAAVVRALGSALLALPRSTNAASAVEVGRVERGSVALLATVTIALGVLSGPVRGLAAAGAAVVHPAGGSIAGRVPDTLGPYQPLVIAVVLTLVVIAVWSFARWRSVPARRVSTWACGIAPTAAHEYTATSFAKPTRLFFEPILRPIRSRSLEFDPGSPFPHRLTYQSDVDHLVESRIYRPLQRAAIRFSQIARSLQQGTLQLYLAYTVVAVVILLMVTRR